METTHPPPTSTQLLRPLTGELVLPDGRVVRLTPRLLTLSRQLANAHPGYVPPTEDPKAEADVKFAVYALRRLGVEVEGRRSWGYRFTVPTEVESEKVTRRALASAR